MKYFKIVNIVFAILISLLIIQTSIFASSSEIQLIFSTGSVGGSFYPIGSAMTEIISKTIDNVNCTAVTSGGVDENINRIQAKKADMGLSSTGDAYLAFRGLESYTQEFDNMRQLGVLYPQYGQVYTLKGKGIKTFLDLKGKVVCAGAPGSSMHKSFFDWVGIHGLEEKDFKKVVYLPAQAAMEALKIGQVDAVMEIAAIPTSAMLELSLIRDIEIIQFAPGYLEKLIEEKPKYYSITIPAGSYRGLDEDIDTVGMAVIWICSKDLPEEIAYQAVKAIYSPEGLDYLKKVHSAAEGITTEGSVGATPIPWHPGAEKYFKEIGLLK